MTSMTLSFDAVCSIVRCKRENQRFFDHVEFVWHESTDFSGMAATATLTRMAPLFRRQENIKKH
jgi:hypothetical protein